MFPLEFRKQLFYSVTSPASSIPPYQVELGIHPLIPYRNRKLTKCKLDVVYISSVFGVFIDAPGFIQIFSGFKNLRMLADIKGTTSDEAIRDAMNLVGLESSCKTLVKNYSLGMKQKLGIAQAIMESQDILLLDEPFNALDESSHRRMCNVIKELKDKSTTILLTSHNMADILELCDEIYQIKNYTIEQWNPPSSLS